MPVSGVALGDRSSSVMSEIDVMHEGMGDDGSLLYQCVRSKFLFNKHKSAFLQTIHIYYTPPYIRLM